MWRDLAYLLDILLAARRIRQYVQSMSWEEFQRNKLVGDAIAYHITVIGAAAGKVARETQDAHPEIPWPTLIIMRQRIMHEYVRMNLPIVWDIVQNDIPALITVIEPLIPPEDAA